MNTKEDSVFKDFTNLYEVRKTVRFELKPQFENANEIQESAIIGNELENFIKNYETILSNFGRIIFSFDKTELRKELKIKFSFLKTYTKKEYYENKIESLKKNGNQIEIGNEKLSYIFDIFKNYEGKNLEILKNIKRLVGETQNSKSRRSDLAYYFHQLSNRNFEFIHELFNNNLNIENDLHEKVEETKKLLNKVDILLRTINSDLLSNQSMGQVIEKSSLNYYTVNKFPKDYDSEIKKFEEKKSLSLSSFTYNNIKKNSKTCTFNWDNIDDNSFKTKDEYENLKIEEAYKLMKEYKANQKSGFYELISKGVTCSDLKEKNSLFNDTNDKVFNEILKLSKEIELLATKKSTKSITKEENECLVIKRKERGKFFDVLDMYDKEKNINGKCHFRKYKKFCDEYKNIAMEFGKIKANIKSIEKEKIDAESINSWALILENKNQKYLLTIPRKGNDTNLQDFRKFVNKLKNEEGNWYLYKFESLTLRALDKLCFGKENNTFRKKININSNNNSQFFNEKGRLKDKFEFKIKIQKDGEEKSILDEELLLKFYITVLGLNSTKTQINIGYFDGFDEFVKKDFDNLDDFEKELKKVCYVKEKFTISSDVKDGIITDFNAKLYKITNYGLQKNDEEVLMGLKYKKVLDRNSPKKNHTNLWNNFWDDSNKTEKYPIRLNPEMKISFVKQDGEFIQKYSNLPFNRRFKERYLLTTTITQNALDKNLNLGFKESEEILETFKNYNSELNNKLRSKGLKYFYGLDRGEKELITMGLFDLSKKEMEGRGIKIEVYEFKKEYFTKINEKGLPIYKNLSYFQYDENKELFEKKDVSCLDLTTAKIINGKIYLNGDISTYMNLKLISAKRKIYDLVSSSNNKSTKIKPDEICNNKVIIIEGNTDKDEILYYIDDRYEKIIDVDNLINELQKYFDKIKTNLSDNDISIEKVNNLRDAVCANMVGIITYLEEKYFGMITFEDKNISWKNINFNQNNTTLGSRIEQKLLQKFSSLNLVPSSYKQIITLQSEKILSQIGLISYVNDENTSKKCPICYGKLYGHLTEDDNKMYHKFGDKDYGPKKLKDGIQDCDYYIGNENYPEFLFIKSGDDLATYNIAKKGKEYLEKTKNT